MSTTDDNKKQAAGRYGRPIAWVEAEIDRFIWDRIRQSRGDQTPSQAHEEPGPPRLIRIAEVTRRTGYSRVAIWRMEKEGRFPRRIYLDDAADREATDAP